MKRPIKNPRSRYSPEFKFEAVRQLLKGEKSPSLLAKELGIRRNQLYKWKDRIKSYGNEAFSYNNSPAQQAVVKTHFSQLTQFVEEPLENYGQLNTEEHGALYWLLKNRAHWVSGAIPVAAVPLAWLGRWSLSWYMLHQSVMIGLLMALAAIKSTSS